MVRSILGVIAAYVIMAGFVFLSFSALFLAIGVDGAYQEGSYDVSLLWVGSTFVLGAIAAALGGFVCRIISKRRGAVLALSVVIVVLGLLMAAGQFLTERPEAPPRGEDVPISEAVQHSVQPAYALILNPIIGAVGALLGGGWFGRSSSEDE